MHYLDSICNFYPGKQMPFQLHSSASRPRNFKKIENEEESYTGLLRLMDIRYESLGTLGNMFPIIHRGN